MRTTPRPNASGLRLRSTYSGWTMSLQAVASFVDAKRKVGLQRPLLTAVTRLRSRTRRQAGSRTEAGRTSFSVKLGAARFLCPDATLLEFL